ncbi:MAG: hypothetical protein NTW55_01420 [Planctomycetota bacterium]|nr:hypothetical protein [Planctomycetota bacterium]
MQVIKRNFWKILLVMLLSVNSIQARPEIIDWEVFSSGKINTSDIGLVYLFIDSNDKMFVEVIGREGDFLWLNNKWVKTDQYGRFLNGFVKDGRLFLAFQHQAERIDERHVDIYAVDKDKDIVLEKRVTLPNSRGFFYIDQVVTVLGENDVFYSLMLSTVNELSSNPAEALRYWMSGGHGILYAKPILTEIRDQTLLEYRKIPYGGKINESYRIKQVLTGKDTIHFLGFRTQKQFGKRPNPSYPDVLHYAEYNVKKKKLVRSQDIYERLPYFDSNDKRRQSYWHISADNFNDDLFVVFSWHLMRYVIENYSTSINMENIDSPIYYSQRNGKTFGNAEVIGNGILPLVRADSLGNVHVIWTNSDGDIVHKVKKDDKWGDEQIVLDGVIDTDEVWGGQRQGEWWLQNMSAEFDKDNNLNVVFTSKGKLVYAKIRFD